MILNTSRASAFQKCRQYAYNWDELRLLPHREADPLMIGEAYHLGSELITKTADVEDAVNQAEARIRERLEGQLILPEERADIERNIAFVRSSVRAWSDQYSRADFKVLWPEVNGCVPLPNTEHHCWFCHRILHPEIPFNECRNSRTDYVLEDSTLGCWQPHFFKFRTDGIIEMGKRVWLLEQKTTSSTNRNHFWTKWNMDFQTRGYCYGVWKATGVLMSGFLLNAIIKHSKQTTVNGERKYQLDPTNVGFEREPFLVTEEDLLSWEREFIMMANTYEDAFRNKIIFKNTQSCFDWNRVCYYWERCKRHNVELEGEFRTRDLDYVEVQYRQLLGLPEEIKCQNQSNGAQAATNSSTTQPSTSAPTAEIA